MTTSLFKFCWLNLSSSTCVLTPDDKGPLTVLGDLVCTALEYSTRDAECLVSHSSSQSTQLASGVPPIPHHNSSSYLLPLLLTSALWCCEVQCWSGYLPTLCPLSSRVEIYARQIICDVHFQGKVADISVSHLRQLDSIEIWSPHLHNYHTLFGNIALVFSLTHHYWG